MTRCPAKLNQPEVASVNDGNGADHFRPPSLSARYRISQATFAGTPGNVGVAPIAAIDVIWRSRHALPRSFSAVLA